MTFPLLKFFTSLCIYEKLKVLTYTTNELYIGLDGTNELYIGLDGTNELYIGLDGEGLLEMAAVIGVVAVNVLE
jgi:hypothetical protein